MHKCELHDLLTIAPQDTQQSTSKENLKRDGWCCVGLMCYIISPMEL